MPLPVMETVLGAAETLDRLDPAVVRATALLATGQAVALPTETVYGLAADALKPSAVMKVFEAKERPFFDPLIVHLPTRDWLERITEIPVESHALVAALIERFWPGPLTLVLPRRAVVPDIVTAGLETVAVRMSAHPVFRAVIELFAGPLAAPSANRFGRISPTTAAHVRSELEGRIPLILDGGPTQHGLESTIVAVEGERLRVLRAGPITSDDLAAAGGIILPPQTAIATRPEAPGQLASHYAPRTRMMLLDPGAHVHTADSRTGLLAWNEASRAQGYAHCEVLSASGDLREAAASLFAKLRRLDEAGLDLILAEPVPEHGLGIAIMDRLRKAAHPK